MHGCLLELLLKILADSSKWILKIKNCLGIVQERHVSKTPNDTCVGGISLKLHFHLILIVTYLPWINDREARSILNRWIAQLSGSGALVKTLRQCLEPHIELFHHCKEGK